MKIAYISLNSQSQNKAVRRRKIEKLKILGIEEDFIFIDKTNIQNFSYPAYNAMKKTLHEGDALYINNLTELGRNYDGIIREWKHITKVIKADIVTLDINGLFDSRKFREMGDIGKLMEDQFLALLSFVAKEEQKKLNKERYERLSMLENRF